MRYWNTVLENNLDKLGGAAQHANKYYQNYINGIINDNGLTRGEERMYTQFNKQYKTASRLNFFLIDGNLVNLPVCKTDIIHGYNSDHSYVSLTIQGSSIERGSGYWKFNNSHLQDEEFVEEVKTIINDTHNSSFDSYSGLWDVIKFKIKDYAIRYDKTKKKRNTEEKEKLLKYIATVKSTANFMADDRLRNQIFEAEVKLNSLLDLETRD